MSSPIDRFRTRQHPAPNAVDWDREELISAVHRKGEELQILICQKGSGTAVVMRNVKVEGSTRIPVRSVSLTSEQIVEALSGIDAAYIRHREITAGDQGDLLSFPFICREGCGLVVKLDRHNNFFNIKVAKKANNEWAILRPNEVEEVIAALVKSYDRISTAAIQEELPF